MKAAQVQYLDPDQGQLVEELEELLKMAKAGDLLGMAAILIEKDKDDPDDEPIYVPWWSGDTGIHAALCWHLTRFAVDIDEEGLLEDDDDSGD